MKYKFKDCEGKATEGLVQQKYCLMPLLLFFSSIARRAKLQSTS
jgi:hypothetical protein